MPLLYIALPSGTPRWSHPLAGGAAVSMTDRGDGVYTVTLVDGVYGLTTSAIAPTDFSDSSVKILEVQTTEGICTALANAIAQASDENGWKPALGYLIDSIWGADDYANSRTLTDISALALEIANYLNGKNLTVVSQYNPARKLLTLVQGDDYNATLGTQIDIPIILPNGIAVGDTLEVSLAATNEQDVSQRIDISGLTLVTVAGKPNVRVLLSASDTESAPSGMYSMQIYITKNSTQYTPIDGRLELLKSQQA